MKLDLWFVHEGNSLSNSFCIEISNKRQGWKSKFLTLVDRLTLIKPLFQEQALPIFLLVLKYLKIICKKTDFIICSFWWGDKLDTRKKEKIHLLSLNTLSLRLWQGGLGLRTSLYWIKPCKPKKNTVESWILLIYQPLKCVKKNIFS